MIQCSMFSYELTCRNCGWRTVCGPADAAARLRLIGLLRREPDPDEEMLAALFVEAAPRMTCPICKEKAACRRAVGAMDDGRRRLASGRAVRSLPRSRFRRSGWRRFRVRSAARRVRGKRKRAS